MSEFPALLTLATTSYPAAWPPHQMLAWCGLERYGYAQDAQRLAYRWLYMYILRSLLCRVRTDAFLCRLTSAFASFNGLVPEKFDAVNLSHNVEAEYGNQGIDFFCVPREGFGWMSAFYHNIRPKIGADAKIIHADASYSLGLTFITQHQRRALGALTTPESLFSLLQRK